MAKKKRRTSTGRGKRKQKKIAPRSRRTLEKSNRRKNRTRSRRPSRRREKLDSPARPTATLLPLLDPNFGWERFEEFCHHLVTLLPGVRDCHRYGTRGSDQKGVDLVARCSRGGEGTYQCRQYERFTRADVQKTVAENEYKAARHTIVVAGVVGTPARDEIKKHKSWELWDATDIATRVRIMDAEAARVLVASHFGADWAEQFLGIKAIPTFVSPGLFYQNLLDPARAFHHALPLIGRSDELAALHAFVESADQQLFVLSGIGGSGKSRLIVELARAFGKRHPDWHLRVVTEGVAVTPDAAREVPVGDCVIVVDDVHRRSDVPAILSMAKLRPGRTKLIFVTRAHAVDRLRADLAWSNLPPATVPLKGLARLDREQTIQLAKEALGPSHATHTEALASAAGDSPLVLVVAAHFLRHKAVDPRILERHEEFRRLVLDRFADEATASFSQGSDRETARKLLPLISALQPISPSSTEVHQALAGFVGSSAPDVARMLGELETAGVLIRRGGLVRIVPDVLADHILHSASVTSAETSTGYADLVFTTFYQSFGSTVLTNLAELDWRLRSTTSGAATILDDVWRNIRAHFESAPHLERGHLLDSLKEVAYLQPDRVLALVEYAIAYPSTVPETGPFADYLAQYSSHSKVLEHIPSVLGHIALHLDYLPRCLELLWELGRDDARATGLNPGHSMRVLVDLAEYDLDKPIAFQTAALNAVENWMNDSDVDEHSHSPLDVLDPILMRTGISHRSTGRAVTMKPFGIDRATTAECRDRAIELLRRYAQHPKPRIVLRVIKSLSHLLAGTPMPLNLEMSDDFYAQWDGERTAALEILSDTAVSDQSPIIKLAVIDLLRPFTTVRQRAATEDKDAGGDITKAARRIIDSIPQDYPFLLLRELRHHNVWEEVDDTDDEDEANSSAKFDRARQRFEERRRQVVDEFLARNQTADEVITAIASEIREVRRHGVEPQIGGFLFTLGKRNPQLAVDVARIVVESVIEDLGTHLGELLISAGDEMSSAASEVAQQAAVSPSHVIRRGAALYLSACARRTLTRQETDLVHRLAQDSDANVRRAALGTMAATSESDPHAALALALAANLNNDAGVCHELFLWLMGKGADKGPISFASDSQLEVLAAKLVQVADIDDHWVLDFVGLLSKRMPDTAIALLLARIERQDAVPQSSRFEAIPFHIGKALNGMAHHQRAGELLRRVAQAFANASGAARHGLGRIFEGMSAHFTTQASIDVLEEMSRAQDAETIVEAAALFRRAGQETFFARVTWVIELLRRATACGTECFDDVRSYLFGAATCDSKHGTPGQPFAIDVSLKERAAKVAQSLPRGSAEREFFESLERHADRAIRRSIEQGELLDE
jgi:hypothetical protein